MPGRRDTAAIDTALCRRCQHDLPAITVRNEALCRACFCRYVSTKVVKRMETFRVRHSEPNQERVLLLPLSFGAASVSLLYALSQHRNGQIEKTGRTGFKLHVLHVQEDESGSAADNKYEVLHNKVKSRFPEHACSTLSLQDVFSLHGISSLTAQSSNAEKEMVPMNGGQLQNLLDSLGSATSRTDVLQILKRKLITNFAHIHRCEAILWGDSTTRLAERVLAETAKGRGYSLPSIVADGESPFGVPFYYPIRDLLSKEITAFASLVEPPLIDLIAPVETKQIVNSKNTTIDDLMKQYFVSVEQEYPSIVANVVKTTGKLQATTLNGVELRCELCDMPLDGAAPEKSRLCYGCIRTLPQSTD